MDATDDKSTRTPLVLYGNTCLAVSVVGVIITCFFCVELPFWVTVLFLFQSAFFFVAGISAFFRSRTYYYFLMTSLFVYSLSFPIGTYFGWKVFSFIKNEGIKEDYMSQSG